MHCRLGAREPIVGGVNQTGTEWKMRLRTALVAAGVAVMAAGAIALGVREAGSQGADAEVFAHRHTSGPLPKLWHAPAFALVDQQGRKITDSSLRGRPFIADFIFTECTSACPTMTSKMVMLERRLASKDIAFVSFSVDSAHDTPEVLAAYEARWNPTETRWSLCATTPSSLAALTAGYRVTTARSADPDAPILHSELFFLVDSEGDVRAVYDSIDPDALTALAIQADALARTAIATPPPPESLYVAMGCAGCHDNAKIAPPLVNLRGSRQTLEGDASVEVDEADVRRSILEPARDRVAGYTVSMPSYERALDDATLGRLVAEILGRTAADAGPPAAEARIAVDPVCGMKVRVDSEAPHADYQGKPYYFCSSMCRDSFAKAPEKYSSGKSSPAMN